MAEVKGYHSGEYVTLYIRLCDPLGNELSSLNKPKSTKLQQAASAGPEEVGGPRVRTPVIS